MAGIVRMSKAIFDRRGYSFSLSAHHAIQYGDAGIFAEPGKCAGAGLGGATGSL
jgi:hypothetical protein